MSEKIRIKYWDKQRMGNYQIRVERLKELDDFKTLYIDGIFQRLSSRITQATKLDEKENMRRWYIEQCHLDYLQNDTNIELVPAFVWRNN